MNRSSCRRLTFQRVIPWIINSMHQLSTSLHGHYIPIISTIRTFNIQLMHPTILPSLKISVFLNKLHVWLWGLRLGIGTGPIDLGCWWFWDKIDCPIHSDKIKCLLHGTNSIVNLTSCILTLTSRYLQIVPKTSPTFEIGMPTPKKTGLEVRLNSCFPLEYPKRWHSKYLVF